MIKNAIIVVITLMTLNMPIYAVDFALISELGSSARAIALGNIEGFSESSTAVFSNPAGLYKSKGYAVSVFSTSIMEEVNYYNVCISGETPFGKVGVGIYEASVLNIPHTEELMNANRVIVPESYFDYKNSTLKIAYQTQLRKKTYLGASYSFFNHTYYTINGRGISADVGIVQEFDAMRVSVFAQNIFPFTSVAYSNGNAEKLPLILSTTLEYPYKDLTLYPQLKYGHSMILVSTGVQYNPGFLSFMNFLMGYKQQLDYTNKRHQKLTFGIELQLVGLTVHYAYERSDYFLLDHHTYISFNTNF